MRRIFKYGLVFIDHGKILLCKPYAFDDYILPGGIREGDETPNECLKREINEELGSNAELRTDSLEYLGKFEDVAAGRLETVVEIEAFLGTVGGDLHASSEIKELVWFGPSDDRSLLSPILRNKLLPELEKKGLF